MNISWKACTRIVLTVLAAYLCVEYWSVAVRLAAVAYSAASPLLIGGVIAYIVNILMSFYERKLPRGNGKTEALHRPLCMLLSFITLAVVALLLFSMILPELANCLMLLLEKLPGALSKAYLWLDEHFNIGFIPVWLLLIEDGQGSRWKAAVSHKGDMLSLVPYEQVFRENRTPGEEFWAATFEGETYFEEHNLFHDVIECTLSHEEKAEITARWRTLVEKWMEEHPYYLNNPGMEYIVTIERVYGVPDEKAIPQSEAEKLAGAALTEHLGNAYLPNRDVRVDYLINDPEHPVWVFRFGRINGLSREEYKHLTMTAPEATSMFNVTLDARTGEVLGIEETQTIY